MFSKFQPSHTFLEHKQLRKANSESRAGRLAGILRNGKYSWKVTHFSSSLPKISFERHFLGYSKTLSVFQASAFFSQSPLSSHQICFHFCHRWALKFGFSWVRPIWGSPWCCLSSHGKYLTVEDEIPSPSTLSGAISIMKIIFTFLLFFFFFFVFEQPAWPRMTGKLVTHATRMPKSWRTFGICTTAFGWRWDPSWVKDATFYRSE